MNTPKKSIEMTFSSNKPQKNLFDVVPDDPLCAKFDEMDMHCSDSSETASEHDFDGSHMIPNTEYDESETDMDTSTSMSNQAGEAISRQVFVMTSKILNPYFNKCLWRTS